MMQEKATAQNAPRPRAPAGVWRPRFLRELALSGNITYAARQVGVNPATVHKARNGSKDFAAQFNQAMEEAVGILEIEARRRAVDGVDRPVFHLGEIVGHVREFSDTLLIFLLKAARPAKYRENVRVTGAVGLYPGQEQAPPDRFTVQVLDPAALPSGEDDRIRSAAMAREAAAMATPDDENQPPEDASE